MLIRSSITWRVAVAVDCTDSVASTGPSTAASRGYVAAAVLAAVAALAVLALAALAAAAAQRMISLFDCSFCDDAHLCDP